MKRFLFLMTLLLTMLYGRAATEVTFDFAANEWKHPLGTALDSDPGNLDELTKDDVLVVFKQAKHKDYPPRYWTGPQVRAYTNNIIRVVAPTGKAITKIEFTATGTSNFGMTAAGGTLEGTTWTGNAAYAKFTATKTNRLTKMVVTLDDANAETDKSGDADEKVFLDFNDGIIHKEFNVISTTYLTEDIVVTDGHRDSDDKIDGENRVTTTIPYIPDVATSKQNYLRYSNFNVSMYLRGGKVVFKTNSDKVFKNIKMTASVFNATLNGEEVTKDQITGDGWEGNSNIVEMEVTGNTNISDITFTIADKPEEVATFAVNIGEIENGTVEADKTEAQEGETVTLTVTPAEGYQLDALTVKDADGADVEVSDNSFTMPASDVTVTATFTIAPVDVDINVESGNDIYAAVTEAAGGAPVKNLTITLAEEGEYTLSKTLNAAGNVAINGNGATVDASAGKEIIKMTAGDDAEKNSKGYWELDNFSIDGVTFKGVTSYVYDDSQNPYIFKSFSITNCVFELNQSKDQDTPFRFQAGGPLTFNMNTSTMYQTGSGNYKYLVKINNGNFPDKAFASFEGPYSWLIDSNTFYNVFNKGELMNGGRVSNNYKKTIISLQNNIFYDCFIEGEKFLKNLFGGKTSDKDLGDFLSITTDLNTYITKGSAIASLSKYDKGTMLTSDPGFADAADGDFTLDFASEQWAQKTGDPRWIADDPTVMVAPESGDFAAIVAQAVKEGKETLALPAGAAYKAGSTIKVDKKLNIIGDENDPATLELGMKGFVIKDALDMENMIIDAATNAEPFIALSAEPNEELLGANNGSDYYNIMDPVILRNLTITGVKGKLIYDNNKKYALDNLLIENCIVQLRTPKDKKETVIYMQGGGIRMLEVNTSTFYQKGQGDNDYFVRYNNSARLDRMGYNKDMEAEDFVPEGFIYESNTFYKVAYEGQWGNYSGFNGQKFTAFTVNKNIWVDCGSGQIARRMLGSRGAEFYEVCEFDQNTYIYNGTAETEGTMKNGEPVGTYDLSGTAITKVPTFKQVATGDFTLDANDVQNKQQTGDPRWFAEEEATGIINVNDNANLNDNQNAPAYNLAGQRVNAQTAKGIIIKNGRKYVK